MRIVSPGDAATVTKALRPGCFDKFPLIVGDGPEASDHAVLDDDHVCP